MRSTKRQARNAALLYLLMLIVGLPGLILVPARLIVDGDAGATAGHIRAAMTLFRFGIASELAYPVMFLFVALALRRLFESVGKGAAAALVALVLVSVPIVVFNVVSELGAAILVGSPGEAPPFTRSQLDSLAYLLIRLHDKGLGVTWVFWALWLVPFGILVIRSGFLPRILGVLLLIAAAADLARAAISVFPSLVGLERAAGLLALGEPPIILWMLIWGFLPERPARDLR